MAASKALIASSVRPVRARSCPRLLYASGKLGLSAMAFRYDRSASTSRPKARSSTTPFPSHASGYEESISIAASNCLSASAARPPRSASMPSACWSSAFCRSRLDGPWAQATRKRDASAACWSRVGIGSEGGEEAGDGGAFVGVGPVGRPAGARHGRRRTRGVEERDPLHRLVLDGAREVPEVEVVEHEAHRLEEVEPLDLEVAVGVDRHVPVLVRCRPTKMEKVPLAFRMPTSQPSTCWGALPGMDTWGWLMLSTSATTC